MSGWERELAVAVRAARETGDVLLDFATRPLQVSLKSDESPVTAADIASEETLLSSVRKEYPDDGVVAEESGVSPSRSGRRWFVDPLDGTKAFVRRLPFWSVLIALEEDGRIVAGVAHFPALGRTYTARRGGGCHRNGERIVCGRIERLDEAVVQVAELHQLLAGIDCERIERIVRGSWLTRSIGDALAGCLVLEGSCDAWIEQGLRPYDVAPFLVLAGEAGAVISDWNGREGLDSGSVLLATPPLHRQLLEILRDSG